MVCSAETVTFCLYHYDIPFRSKTATNPSHPARSALFFYSPSGWLFIKHAVRFFFKLCEFELFIKGLNPNPTELGERIIKMNIGACSECSWIIHFTGHRPWIHPVFLIYLFDLNRFVRFSSRIRFATAKCEQVSFCAFGLIADFLR